SGSNAFHGSAWEFNRNDGLKAAEFFENARGLKKGLYNSNQFGFTAGGPVVKNKTFFFADYEGSLTKQDQIWQVTVPTQRQRDSGFTDFSDLITGQTGTRGPDLLGRTVPLGTIFDPATTRPVFAGQIDPVTGRVATGNGFVGTTRHKPGPFEGAADGGAYAQGDETGRTHGLALSHTKMFSASLINEARFGFSREYINRLQPLGDDTSNIPGEFGIQGIPQIKGNGG